jgi:transposase
MAKALLDDDLWALIEPLLPPAKPRRNKYPGVSRSMIERF